MPPAAPSPRELEILKALWDLGPATVRQVHETLYPRGQRAFNTVQTLLRIMERKGLVRRQRAADGERALVYAARRSREQITRGFLDRLFDGALDDCLLTLLRAKDVDARELEELERIVSEARKQARER